MEIVQNRREMAVSVGEVALVLLMQVSSKVQHNPSNQPHDETSGDQTGDCCNGGEHLAVITKERAEEASEKERRALNDQDAGQREQVANGDKRQRAHHPKRADNRYGEVESLLDDLPPAHGQFRAIEGCGRASEGQFRSSLATGKGSAGKNIGINLMPMSL